MGIQRLNKWTVKQLNKLVRRRNGLLITCYSLLVPTLFFSYLFGASGEGSLTISPNKFKVGEYLPGGTTFTFTVGASSISIGSRIVINIPGDWTLQSENEAKAGYISTNTITTDVIGPVVFSVKVDTSSIFIEVTSGVVGINKNIYINYRNFKVPCYVKQNIEIPAYSCSDAKIDLKPISVFPTVNINPGPPEYISFETWGLIIKKDTASPAIKFTLRDNYWNITKATAPIIISLTGKFYNTTSGNYEVDTTAKFSASVSFSPEVTSITIPVDSSEAVFYYKTSKTGSVITEISYYLNYEKINSLWLTVISEGITGAKIHNGNFANNTNITITPDGDGINDLAYIDFNISEQNISWQVIIATSTDFALPLWTYWGYGLPSPGRIMWDGNLSYYDPQSGYWRCEKAPNGTYKIRIQFYGGGIVNDTLSVTVETLQISGRVVDEATAGISGVYVNAWGPSCSYTQTDSKGYYKLSGLRSGKYTLNFYKTGYPTKYKYDVSAPSTNVNVMLEKAGILKINATRNLSATAVDPENWGGINVYSQTNSYWGSLHFAEEVGISDNGIWTSTDISKNYLVDNATETICGKWTVIFVAPGTYDIRADLWGYGDKEKKGVSISAGQIKEITDITFARKKSISGVVSLSKSSAESWGTWVSVEAIPSGKTYGTAWGGCNIPQGETTGNYTIFGVEAGNYTLKAFAPGYQRGTATVSIAAGVDAAVVPEIVLGTGGQLTGTVTVIGDTTPMGSEFSLYINAWSPENYSYSYTQIQIATHTSSASATYTIRGLEDGTYFVSSWLNGFELDGGIGFSGVKTTVSNGSGSVNLTFRRYSGKVTAKFIVPGNDYGNLKITMSGHGVEYDSTGANTGGGAKAIAFAAVGGGASSGGASFDTATGIFTSPPVGSGYCRIEGIYLPSGMQKSKSIMAVNGQTKDAGEIDLTGATYSVSGRVKIDTKNPPTKPFDDLAVLVSSAAAIGEGNKARVYISGSDGGIRGTAYDGGSSGKSFTLDSSGTFTIRGLLPGVYTLEFPSLELDGNRENGYEMYRQQKRVVVDQNLTGIEMAISGGYSVSGNVYLPEGEPAVTREFWIDVRKGCDWVTNKRVNFLNSNSASYEVKNLPPGEYTLSINDWGYWDSTAQVGRPRQFASASINIEIEGSNISGKDLRLKKGGNIKFKLKDKESGTVITPQNANKMLPSNFEFSAHANPWVEGGYGYTSLSSISGTAEEFGINCLSEASYDLRLGQSSYGFGIMGTAYGNNQANYAAVTISSIKVKEGQTADLGIIELRQGLSISGVVKDKNGALLPNIPVVADPSLTNEWQSQLQAITDTNGRYTITGLDPEIPYYDIVACPRSGFCEVDYFFGLGGIIYGEKVRPMVKIKEAGSVDFVLEEALGSVKGKVLTEAGKPPVSLEEDEMGCMVFMQLENTIPRTNPIGDIFAIAEFDGSFRIEALPKGTYDLIILAPGYSSISRRVTVEDKEIDFGTLILKVGAKIAGKITRPDGKNLAKGEIDNIIIAVTDDLSDVLVGQVKEAGGEIIGYELNGFQAGKSYNILFILPHEEFEMVPAVCGFTVAYSSYVNTNYNLVYKPVKPMVFSRASRDGSKFIIHFELTSALRNLLPADNDLAQILTVVTGKGQLSDRYLAPNRKVLSCIYTAPAGENRFVLQIRGYSRIINQETGSEFGIDEKIEYYCGIGAKNRVRISYSRGGKVVLEGDVSIVEFPAGAFEVPSSTVSIFIEFTRAETIDILVGESPKYGAPRFSIPRAAPAYSGLTYKAMQTLKTVAITPFSSFYEIMLPKGISRMLKKPATLSLQYSTATITDPTELNIYYYDEQNDAYLLQNSNKKIDTDANKITVSIERTSVFVLLRSNQAVITGNTYLGAEVIVYNFPNPFNLTIKTKNLAHASGQQMTTKGTIIKYAIPSSYGEVDINFTVYNIVGEVIRELPQGKRAGGYYYYTEWNGENDYGKEVASGVYLGKLKVGKDKPKFFKMAVIK